MHEDAVIETTLRSKATAHECRKLARSAADFLQQFIPNPEVLYELELVITEACSNVILHGYGQDHNGDIELRIALDTNNRIFLELRDWGEPFHGPGPEAFDVTSETESGRGLFIISELSDAYAYTRENGTNVLRIEKDINP
jgi:serine/threonine-protein kinase RsbW